MVEPGSARKIWVSLSGLPLTISLEWPFHRSTSGAPACAARCPLGSRERPGLLVPVGQDHAGADGSKDGQSHRGADLAAGIERTDPIPDDPSGTEAIAAVEPAGTIRAKPTPTRT